MYIKVAKSKTDRVVERLEKDGKSVVPQTCDETHDYLEVTPAIDDNRKIAGVTIVDVHDVFRVSAIQQAKRDYGR